MSLLKLAAKAKKIDIQKLALQVATANTGLINERIRGQLVVGEAGDGGKVGLYKSPRYASFKSRIGSLAPSGTVDLKLSGRLYKGIETKITNNTFNTASKVDYSKYQIDRYGKRIYELQKDNQQDIRFKNSFDTVKEYKQLLEV